MSRNLTEADLKAGTKFYRATLGYGLIIANRNELGFKGNLYPYVTLDEHGIPVCYKKEDLLECKLYEEPIKKEFVKYVGFNPDVKNLCDLISGFLGISCSNPKNNIKELKEYINDCRDHDFFTRIAKVEIKFTEIIERELAE